MKTRVAASISSFKSALGKPAHDPPLPLMATPPPTTLITTPTVHYNPQCKPVFLNTTATFLMRARPFAQNHIVSNRSPSFRTQPHHFERKPVLSKHNRIVSNASLFFQNATPSFRMAARRFEHNPILSNASPSFRTQPWTPSF